MTDVLDRLKNAVADRYSIEHELGSGGMATVYLAKDLKHERQVALKLLRPELGAVLGGERFLNEIRVTANLNHPHILPLLDSGSVEEPTASDRLRPPSTAFLYYVMPFVAGESLREKLERETQLSIEEAIELTRQVAAALDYAHRQGVVHRDIKPENILLQEGQAVVADFGIARALRVAGGERLTETGLSLGTPHYMSPEQASGTQELDGRSDVYSLGCVLYEMLVGDPPFTGPTAPAIIARQLVDPVPSLRTVRPTVTEELERAIEKALAKVPADRYDTAGAFVEAAGAGAQVEVVPTRERRVPRRRFSPKVWRVGAAAAALLVVIAVVLFQTLRPGPLTITTANERNITTVPGLEFQPALSPDGRDVAYVTGPIGNPRIAVRSAMDVGGGVTRLAEAVGGLHWLPMWAPDGAFVHLWVCQTDAQYDLGSECEWKETDRLGGSVRTLGVRPVGDRPVSDFVAWSRDGTRITLAANDSIFAQTVDEGEAKLLDAHTVDRWPLHSLAWSPDGRRIAYVKGNYLWRKAQNVMSVAIWVVDADGGTSIRVTDEASMNLSPQWLPDSRHLLFVSDRDGTRGIYVVEVGADGPRGLPRSVLPSSDAHSISVSADGKSLAYARFPPNQNIWWVPIPRSGVASIGDGVPLTVGNQLIEIHSVSPDGASIAYDNSVGGNADIYVRAMTGGDATRIADLPDNAMAPQWSPDGAEIAFYSDGKIFVVPATAGVFSTIVDTLGGVTDPVWSPDGRRIAFLAWFGGHKTKVGVVSRDRVGGAWGTPTQMTDFYCGRPLLWDADGTSTICRLTDSTTSADTEDLVKVSREGQIVAHFNDMPLGPSAGWSRDGSRLYIAGTYGGSKGIWWMLAGGGALTKVVAFDDPSLTVPWDAFSVSEDRIYLTIAQYESDIRVVDLEW